MPARMARSCVAGGRRTSARRPDVERLQSVGRPAAVAPAAAHPSGSPGSSTWMGSVRRVPAALVVHRCSVQARLSRTGRLAGLGRMVRIVAEGVLRVRGGHAVPGASVRRGSAISVAGLTAKRVPASAAPAEWTIDGRQADGEPRPAARPVRDRDPAIVEVDDRLGDREAEARPAGRCAGRPPEALEDLRHVLGADARAVVVDVERSPRGLRVRTGPGPSRRAACGGRRCRRGSRRAGGGGRVAVDDRGLGVEREADAAVGRRLDEAPRAVGGDVAEIDRQALRLMAPESERARRSSSSTRRGQVADLGIDVVERLDRRRGRGRGIAAEMLDRARG